MGRDVQCPAVSASPVQSLFARIRPENPMRRHVIVLLLASLTSPLGAQGRVVTSCPRPIPSESVARPCAPSTPSVVRVATSTLVDITGRVARTTITETFENRGRTIGEADFLYPLPNGAAFEELRLEIDGKLVAGEVLDASRARETYERIVRELRDPALVEWAGLGMVRTRIFPFGAGERRTVVVRHRHVLPRDGDALRVNGRLVGVDDPRDETAAGSFRIRWSGDSLGAPWSPTHDVQARRLTNANSVREVSLTGRSGDVLAYLPIRLQSRTPGVTVLTHRGAGSEQHALVIVSPPRETPPAVPRDISLVLDVSGSMKGTKLEQAIAAGHALLQTLRTGDRFRLIAFADDVDANTPELAPVTPMALREGRQWLDALEARGGTNIGDALRSALAATQDRRRNSSRLPLVLLVTDGQPTTGLRALEILDSTPAWRGEARVFTFGVGADVDASLVEQLALGGRGAAQFVRPEESVERAVSLVAQRLAAPLLSNVNVTVDGGTLRQLYAPNGVDLMAGQELVFLARYTGSARGQVRVTGVSGNDLRVTRAAYAFGTRDTMNGFVPRLWAVQRVTALDAERRRRGPNAEIDDELRLLGERFGVPTPLTSYLVTEPTRVVQHGVQGGVQGGNVGVVRAVATGGTSPSMIAADVSAKSAPAPSAVAFESARRASEQRAVLSMSAADAMLSDRDASGGAGRRSRVVAGRLFDLIDSTWTDRRLITESTWRAEITVHVRAFSPAWTALAQAIPALREPLALGDRVNVRGARAVIEVSPRGVEQLDRATIDGLVSRW